MTLVHRNVLDLDARDALDSWVAEVQAWPAGSHRDGQYAEQTARGAVICRTENVSVCHSGIASLVDGILADIAAEALGEPVSDFKDKCNYKQPGGAGFRPHQDARAYPGVEQVVSILLAVDECATDSGCLWIAPDVDDALPVDDRGVVRDDVAGALTFEAAELAPGDALVIPGFAPHYSDENRTNAPRRVLIASYTTKASGYDRDTYYSRRRAAIDDAVARDGRFRISTLADFAGVEVGDDAAALPVACTHGGTR